MCPSPPPLLPHPLISNLVGSSPLLSYTWWLPTWRTWAKALILLPTAVSDLRSLRIRTSEALRHSSNEIFLWKLQSSLMIVEILPLFIPHWSAGRARLTLCLYYTMIKSTVTQWVYRNSFLKYLPSNYLKSNRSPEPSAFELKHPKLTTCLEKNHHVLLTACTNNCLLSLLSLLLSPNFISFLLFKEVIAVRVWGSWPDCTHIQEAEREECSLSLSIHAKALS